MRKCRNGFTLVEILIVVVILGILAAIVVPQFTNASNEAVKGAIQSQLQTINSQVELYRVRNNGDYGWFDAAVEDGWGELVGGEYLKEQPVNGYTGESVVVVGTEADAETQDRDSANGWYWDDDTGGSTFTVYAAAYDEELDLLAHEDGFGL
jgi:general secretion pathway protein G